MRILCLTALFVMLLPSIGLGAAIGTVTKTKGSVSYRTGSAATYKALATGQPVGEGDWLKTGKDGWAELTLSDGSHFTIANNTELELTRFVVGTERREGAFNLVEGKLRASVVKLAGKQSDIKVKSGTAVAGVKGTEFLMLANGPANVFFGNEGSVAVSGSGGGSRPLLAQTMTQTTRGSEPVEPIKVEPGTSLAEAQQTFNAATGAEPPADWAAANNLSTIIARWNVNYGHYLADRGNYREALHVFQIAIDLTKVPEIRADAWLERGTVQGRFLDNPRAALAEFLLVLEEYPRLPQAEIALFSVGQTLYELQLHDQARTRLRQYLDTYPTGRYRSTVETLLRQLERQR